MNGFFLTIAASDSSGGAGIQQDCRVAADHHFWPLSVITAVTSQNFQKLYEIHALSTDFVERMLLQIFKDFPVTVVKIGALATIEIAEVVLKILQKSCNVPIIWDPVFRASDGNVLSDIAHNDFLLKSFLHIATVVTPNKSELELLLGREVENFQAAKEMTKKVALEQNVIFVLKGGHFASDILSEAIVGVDLLYEFRRRRLNFSYQHGTGCTFASAFACNYVIFQDPIRAYHAAVNYLELFYRTIHNSFSMDNS